jgi:hypothetical protein
VVHTKIDSGGLFSCINAYNYFFANERRRTPDTKAKMASNPVGEFITKLMAPKSKGEEETLVCGCISPSSLQM